MDKGQTNVSLHKSFKSNHHIANNTLNSLSTLHAEFYYANSLQQWKTHLLHNKKYNS